MRIYIRNTRINKLFSYFSQESAPCIVRNRSAKVQRLLHGGHVKVFYRDHIVIPCQPTRHLVQEIAPPMLGFRIQPCDLFALSGIVGRLFDHPGQLPLFPGDLRLMCLVLFFKLNCDTVQFISNIFHMMLIGYHITMNDFFLQIFEISDVKPLILFLRYWNRK